MGTGLPPIVSLQSQAGRRRKNPLMRHRTYSTPYSMSCSQRPCTLRQRCDRSRLERERAFYARAAGLKTRSVHLDDDGSTFSPIQVPAQFTLPSAKIQS